jgi:hypothetical protein
MYLSSAIAVSTGDFIRQTSSNANARVSFSSTDTTQIYVEFLANTFTTGSGNISLVDGSNVANITALNVYPVSTTTTSNVITALYTTGQFTQGSGNLKLNGSFFAANVYPTANAKIPNTITLSANIGDSITQPSTGANATVTANVTDAISIPVVFDSGVFNINSGNIKINGSNIAVYPTEITQAAVRQTITANVGDYITQSTSGANAIVTANVVNVIKVPVTFLANSFTTGSGNLQINGSNVKLYPHTVTCSTDITATYIDSNTFELNTTDAVASIQINSSNTNSYISTILNVGITVGALATEGTEGFDETKFDQGTLDLPSGLTINTTTGWITGQLPNQTANETVYDFEVLAYKRDDPTYQDNQLFYLTILGDMNNTINWITDEDLGSIQNGKISDLYVLAESSKGKTLTYSLTAGEYQNLPQGMKLLSSGLLSGRISFELFSLDSGATGIDENAIGESTTTFDQTFEFTVTATDIDRTISADRRFTIKIINANKKPYENLYLKALPTQDQRTQFTNIIQDQNVFPLELVYRNQDPHFGLAKSIKTLFLPGLNPTSLADYVQAAETNHFMKRITFGDIKTAQALDSNFDVKYEVVYLEIKDDNTNSSGQGPSDTVYPLIDNPYYDLSGNAYTVAYPNSFTNMRDIMIDEIGFANKGVLPDWMTSKQTNDKVLGFVRAVVLGYTVPGSSEKIAYRLREQEINFNTIDFTVDRYQLDNVYTENYDIAPMPS